MGDMVRREVVYLWYYFSIQFEQIFRYWGSLHPYVCMGRFPLRLLFPKAE